MGVYQLARLEIILYASHQRVAVTFCTPENPLDSSVELISKHKDIVLQIFVAVFDGDWTPIFAFPIEEITIYFTRKQKMEVYSQIQQENLVSTAKASILRDLKYTLLKFARISPDLLKISWDESPDKITIQLSQKHALLPQDFLTLFQTYTRGWSSRSPSLNSEFKEHILHFYPDLGAQYPQVYQFFSTMRWLFETFPLYYLSPLGVFHDQIPREMALWPSSESLGEKQRPPLSKSSQQIVQDTLQVHLADFTHKKTASSTEIQWFLHVAAPLLAPKIIRFNPDVFSFYFVSEDPTLHSRSEIEAVVRNFGFSTRIQEKLKSIPPNKVHLISYLHLPSLSLSELYGFSLVFHSVFHIPDREPSILIIDSTLIALSHKQNSGIELFLSHIVTRKPCSLVRFLDLGTK